MSVAEMCALAELSRAGYYRFLTTPAAGGTDEYEVLHSPLAIGWGGRKVRTCSVA
jgi:hypothetical protein